VINVGGQKVYPQEVELVIAQHPDVHMVRVWARRNPITGALVAADVVMRPGAIFTDIHDDIVQLCRNYLADWQVPVSIRQVDDIAITPGGKIARA
jgi:acyl-CoA synthetase (AMP-forming)/AMP-acid ligase II